VSAGGRPRAFWFVVLVGVMSLFADVTYEGARGVNGQFLGSLGASALVVSAVAGLGELAGYGLRFVSGRWVDRGHGYWPMTFFGYFVNLLAVPALALAGNWPLAAGLMLLERTGKAIRSPPRDAMLSHAAHGIGAGWAFGLHAALDETGAALGPLLVALVLWRRGGYSLAYACLLAPALVALALLFAARRLNPRPRDLEPASHAPAVAGFGRRYWTFTGAGALIAAGFADFSLMSFHLSKHGVMAEAAIPLLYALANGMNAASSLALGRAFDRWGPHVLSVAVVLPLASAPLVFFGGAPLVLTGMALWSLGVTVQQSLFKAMLTSIVGASRRASGFGTFDGVWGVASFAGSLLLGYLYDVSLGALVAASVALQVAAVPAVWLVTRRAARPS
jgi:predicted MFS family arabinose efflux permease